MGEERSAESPGREERGVDRLQQAIAALGHSLGSDSLEPVAAVTAEQAMRLVNASTLLLLLEDAGCLLVAAAAGEAPAGAPALREPVDGAAWRRVMLDHQPDRVDVVGGRLAAGLTRIGVNASAALVVPLLVGDRAIGAIAAFDRADGPQFEESDQNLLTAFAGSVAMAVAPIQSLAEARLRESIEVAERERARWARELHDDTLQGLGALRVRLANALRQGEAEMTEAVEHAVLQIEDEIASLRSLITELRPAALDELGLGAAIESLAESQAAASELEINLDLALEHEDGTAPRRLQRELESAIYRVIQEALTNTTKHANAERVWIEVAEDADSILIVVRDDGAGFDMNRRGRGFGLVGMRERIALEGGSLAIVSSPGTGTELRGRIPKSRDHSTSSIPRSSA
jgi:signal transduction histidine kinase